MGSIANAGNDGYDLTTSRNKEAEEMYGDGVAAKKFGYVSRRLVTSLTNLLAQLLHFHHLF